MYFFLDIDQKDSIKLANYICFLLFYKFKLSPVMSILCIASQLHPIVLHRRYSFRCQFFLQMYV